jgi:hypothetical protein
MQLQSFPCIFLLGMINTTVEVFTSVTTQCTCDYITYITYFVLYLLLYVTVALFRMVFHIFRSL